MSEPRGGVQARTFHDALTTRAIPEATEAEGDPHARTDGLDPPPEAGRNRPPEWAADSLMRDDPPPVPPVPPPAPIPNNIMLHVYRALEPAELDLLREVKDLALALWNTLHQIDQSSAEDGDFLSRRLGNAGARLEECVLWVEKHFLE